MTYLLHIYDILHVNTIGVNCVQIKLTKNVAADKSWRVNMLGVTVKMEERDGRYNAGDTE